MLVIVLQIETHLQARVSARLRSCRPVGGPPNPPFVEDADWIEMANIPLLAAKETTTKAILGAPKGGDAGNTENHPIKAENAVPSTVACPTVNPTNAEGDSTSLGERVEDCLGEPQAAGAKEVIPRTKHTRLNLSPCSS